MPKMKGKPVAADDEEDTPVAGRTAKKKSTEPGVMYPISERTLNLTSPGGQPHYARLEMAIEFAIPRGAKAQKAGAEAKSPVPLVPILEPVEAHKAQIDDLLVRVVGSKTMDQMTTNEGREALKQELLDGVTEIVDSPEATSVYILRLIVQ
jgi:flagellar basal body-associated protein FliL